MNKTERQATIKFLEDYRKDLLKQVFFNIQKGNKDNKEKLNIINDITRQQFVNKELKLSK